MNNINKSTRFSSLICVHIDSLSSSLRLDCSLFVIATFEVPLLAER